MMENNLRPEVKAFAEQMEDVLKSKDHLHPMGWSKDHLADLFGRLDGKVLDLADAIDDHAGADVKLKLCVDIANFAMMIADKTLKGK